MSSREEFEKEMCNEYLWFGEALELAHFHGDDATGYYTGGGYIYDGTSCAEALFWAWRGWQASKTKSQSQLTALTTQLESVVAEHAALSKFIDDECYVYGPHDVEPVDAALEKPETPATSAFLAEVRASGVDELNDTLCKLLPGCQYMDPPDGGSVSPLEQVSRMVADYRERMEAAERRNAELEAREVKLPPLVDTSNVPFAAHTWNCYRAEAVKALRAAGISVKGE
ncbi:TPA: hypothetical protein IHD35_000546 [Escherichia coli]|nr:hypothetical protein [Escherichia coli]